MNPKINMTSLFYLSKTFLLGCLLAPMYRMMELLIASFYQFTPEYIALGLIFLSCEVFLAVLWTKILTTYLYDKRRN